MRARSGLLVALALAAGAGCSRAGSKAAAESRAREESERGAKQGAEADTVAASAFAPKSVVVAAPPFPLKVSPDHRYLVDQKGAPFLIHGDAAWSLFVEPNREGVETYLEDRRKRGVNLLLVNLLEHKFSSQAPRNASGQPPFTKAGDFATPNEAYFAHVDWVLQRAAQRGLSVLLCPAYLGYGGGEEGWYRDMVKSGPEKLRAYGRYVGERYKGYDNLVWLEGGDFTPPPEHLALVNAVAEGIKEKDSRHLHAAHYNPETSASEIGVSGWLDVNTTYTYQPAYVKSLADRHRGDQRPYFLIESAYEGERDSTPQTLRAQAYYALLSGAAGQIFGHGLIWQFKPKWAGALGSPGAVGMGHLRALFAPRAWNTLVPDETNEVLVEGQGSRGGMDYAVLAKNPEGTLAIAYVPSVRDVTIDLGKLALPVRAQWYDPTTGALASVAGSPFQAPGRAKVHPSGPNGAGQPDWALLLETHSP